MQDTRQELFSSPNDLVTELSELSKKNDRQFVVGEVSSDHLPRIMKALQAGTKSAVMDEVRRKSKKER